MDTLDPIIISDSNSPVKGCNTIAPCSPINNVIVISDSPKKTSQKRIQYKDLTSSSSSDEQNRLPILKRKGIKLSHHITAKKQRNDAKGVIVSSESDEELTETITHHSIIKFCVSSQKTILQGIDNTIADGMNGIDNLEKNVRKLNTFGLDPTSTKEVTLFLLGYGSLGHIKGSDCLRKFSVECGAKQPNLLRSIKISKQSATRSQILNLKENELDILANFLGHDVRNHRELYRLPKHTLEIAKVSKLLISLKNGVFSGLVEKSLAEIAVNSDEGELNLCFKCIPLLKNIENIFLEI
ncbi:unnamed protein product [Mytilus edulis]|uniref:Uncharacterized protein n=1 Tax=Mytilus edulis TaxID=6550 RepID=A0A8S3RPC1_MYTED|nr:unnamed protein product [Mytilus edulis]